jgi:hypothetical protein
VTLYFVAILTNEINLGNLNLIQDKSDSMIVKRLSINFKNNYVNRRTLTGRGKTYNFSLKLFVSKLKPLFCCHVSEGGYNNAEIEGKE